MSTDAQEINLIEAGNWFMLAERGLTPAHAKVVADQWHAKCAECENLRAALAAAQAGPQDRGWGQAVEALITWLLENPWNSSIRWQDYLEEAIRSLRPATRAEGEVSQHSYEVKKTFVNEKGNLITIAAFRQDQHVTISMSGPLSKCSNAITEKEALMTIEVLTRLFYRNSPPPPASAPCGPQRRQRAK